MAIIKPIRASIQAQFLNAPVAEQAEKWDFESHLLDFERTIDMLDAISDGLIDDTRTANALIGVTDKFSKIHAEFKSRLLG